MGETTGLTGCRYARFPAHAVIKGRAYKGRSGAMTPALRQWQEIQEVLRAEYPAAAATSSL